MSVGRGGHGVEVRMGLGLGLEMDWRQGRGVIGLAEGIGIRGGL